MKITSSLLLYIFIFTFGFLSAQESQPKIGLVLSGGGSRGYAHIGVIKVLEELNIRPDYITGTSQGSLVGAMYALGYSSADIENFIKDINWDRAFTDKPNYEDISALEKKYYSDYPFEIFLDKGYIPRLNPGFIEGHEVQNLFSKLTWRSNFYKSFDDFPIPFRCVASDLVSGKPKVFKKGDLASAMRASMSVPSVFAPVDIDSLLLVDGGVFRNFPVKECKEMGADYIIGVYVVGNNDTPKKEEINSLLKVIIRSAKSFANDLEEEDILKTDILIIPELNEFRGIEMKQSKVISKRGEEAARNPKVYNQLKALADRLGKRDNKTIIKNEKSILIQQIELKGSHYLTRDKILTISKLKENSNINASTLAKAIEQLYATGNYKKVTYQIKRQGIKNILELDFVEKKAFTIRVGSRYNLSDWYEGLIDLSYRTPLINNSTLRLKTSLAKSPRAQIDYRIKAIPSKLEFSIKTFAQYDDLPGATQSIYTDIDLGNCANTQIDLSFDIALNPLKNLYLQAGVGNLYTHSIFKDGFEKIAQIDKGITNTNYFNTGFELNTFNDAYFPTKGVRIRAKFTNQFNINSQKTNAFSTTMELHKTNKIYNFEYKQALAFSRSLSLISGLNMGNYENDVSYNQKFFIGGDDNSSRPNRINYPGFKAKSIISNQYIIADLGLQYNYKERLFIELSGSALNLQAYPVLFKDFKNEIGKDLNKSIQLKLSYKTFIGPSSIALTRNIDQDTWVPSINIGINF